MPTATTTSVHDVTEFIHQGRKRKIFRRTPQGNFYIRKQVGGSARWKTLDTPIKSVAIRNARCYLDQVSLAAVDEKWSRLDPLRSKNEHATIGQIVERYLARAVAAISIDPHTVQANSGCLLQLLRIAHGTTTPEALRADILTETTIRRFVEAARLAGRSESGIRSVIVQARSVVSPTLAYIYEGMKIPPLDGFRVRMKFHTADDIGFEDYPAATIAAMETAAAALRCTDPATWLVYMLMSRLGLRNIECERATLSWLDPDDIHIDIPASKGGTTRRLPLPSDLPAATIREIAGEGPALIPADSMTQRKIICQRTINRFVKTYIPEGAYWLRKWAGSLVWSTQDHRAAQRFLGHRSIATTEKYYARDLRPIRSVSPADREQIYPNAESRNDEEKWQK